MLCLVLCLFLFKGIFALEVEIPDDLKDDRNLPREERIRRHQKRVQLILDARRKTKEEEKKQEELLRPPPPQPGKPSPPPPPSDGLGFSSTSDKTLAQTILHFYPFDTTVKAGDSFLTDMVLFNMENQTLDSLKVTITFDPKIINPVYVNDFNLKDRIETPAKYQVDMERGRISYDCLFKTPQSLENEDILRIVWKAIRPTEFTEISFDLTEDATSLLSNNKDVLGTPHTRQDGIIPTGVTILSDMKSRDDFMIVDKEIISQAGLNPAHEIEGHIILYFETEKKPIKAGDIFDVSIMLSNHQGQACDKVSLLLRFDPGVLKVVDWDKKNRIGVGVNIQDGFSRKRYPFDFHIRNEASNFTGIIDYRMGSSKPVTPPSGELAKIRFQAIAPSEETGVFFIHKKDMRGANTSVALMGAELISPQQWRDETNHGLILQVIEP